LLLLLIYWNHTESAIYFFLIYIQIADKCISWMTRNLTGFLGTINKSTFPPPSLFSNSIASIWNMSQLGTREKNKNKSVFFFLFWSKNNNKKIDVAEVLSNKQLQRVTTLDCLYFRLYSDCRCRREWTYQFCKNKLRKSLFFSFAGSLVEYTDTQEANAGVCLVLVFRSRSNIWMRLYQANNCDN
jgi:hypothetical protein